MKSKHWLWAFAALPLVCVPLIAQENRDVVKDAAQKNAQDAKPAPAAPTAQVDAKAAESPEPVSTDKPEPADERISADNNTSFPVDI
ncbi:MAG: hypothetical protein WDO12_08010 [Pseudomonadota bacterium]